MSHLHKISWIWNLFPLSQISEDIVAICVQMPDCRSLPFVPKNSVLAVSQFLSSCPFSFATDLSTINYFLIRSPLSELCAPASNCSVDIELICWVICARQEFCVRWIRISATYSFQNSTTQSTDALGYWVTSFFETSHHLCGDGIRVSFRCLAESSVPLLFIAGAKECPVSSRESLRFLTCSEFEMHLSELPPSSNRCHWTLAWRWSVLQNFQVQCLILEVFLDRLENLQSMWILGNIPLEPNRFSINSKWFSVRIGQSKFFKLIIPSSGDEQLRRDQETPSWTIIRTKSGSSWSSYEKPFWDGRIETISGSTFDEFSRRRFIEN